jgi:hypothetical protein
MLTHRASAMKSNAIRWTLPLVAMASEPKVRESNARTTLMTSRKLGFRDKPGARMLEKKSLSVDGDLDSALSPLREMYSCHQRVNQLDHPSLTYDSPSEPND